MAKNTGKGKKGMLAKSVEFVAKERAKSERRKAQYTKPCRGCHGGKIKGTDLPHHACGGSGWL